MICFYAYRTNERRKYGENTIFDPKTVGISRLYTYLLSLLTVSSKNDDIGGKGVLTVAFVRAYL